MRETSTVKGALASFVGLLAVVTWQLGTVACRVQSHWLWLQRRALY